MIRRSDEVDCPECGSTVNRDRFRSHMRRQHRKSVPQQHNEPGIDRSTQKGLISCKSCGKRLALNAFIKHRCKSRSIRTLAGGGGPGTGKRR